MQTVKQVINSLVLVIALIPASVYSQYYTVTLKTGEIHSQLSFVALEDSILVMQPDITNNVLYNYPVGTLASLQIINPGNFSEFGLQPARKSYDRGFLGGFTGGCLGTVVGATGGYLAMRLFTGDKEFTEFNQGYAIVGQLTGIVGGSLWGLIYFTNHKIGFKPEIRDFEGYTDNEIYRELQQIFTSD